MKTTVAAGAALSANDTEIVKALVIASNASGTLSRTTGLLFHAGVRNEAGVIYRSASFHSRNQLMRLATRMEKIGYVNELLAVQGALNGFDAIYSPAETAGAAPGRFSLQAA